MKLFRCDGRVMTVRDVGPVIYEVRATGAPLKPHGWWIEDDEAARARLRELRQDYDGGPVDEIRGGEIERA